MVTELPSKKEIKRQAKKLAKQTRKLERSRAILENFNVVAREKCLDSFYFFFRFFWPELSDDDLVANWHIKYLCDELQTVAENVGARKPKEYDLFINIPPGSSKTSIVSIAFPAWCWTRYHWMRFITAGYSATLSLEAAEYSRDMIRSERFIMIFPELGIKDDKDTKSNFRIIKKVVSVPGKPPRLVRGGNRFSTSVGGTLTGFHGHILIIDDPLNPQQAISPVLLEKANKWCGKTLSTRKANKKVTVTIFVMQRLHQNDPIGYMLEKAKKNKAKKIKHICLPAEVTTAKYKTLLSPQSLLPYYKNGLLDPVRMPWSVLDESLSDLGESEYAGQMGQSPTPPGGSLFKIGNFTVIDQMPNKDQIVQVVRYWDKAGTAMKEIKKGRKAAFTAGVKIAKLRDGRCIILDVVRGQWGALDREIKIKQIAELDEMTRHSVGQYTETWIEQEPGSGGKESAESTIRNLAGHIIESELPKGDKATRAVPYSIQVNGSNVLILRAEWNKTFIDEHEFFPFSTYKDQVDAAGAGFAKLNNKKVARVLGKDIHRNTISINGKEYARK